MELAAEAALEPQDAPVAVLTEPEDFVPEPFDEEPYEYAPEPTVTHVAAAERQETYEFDALPDEAFDLEPPVVLEPPRRRSVWASWRSSCSCSSSSLRWPSSASPCSTHGLAPRRQPLIRKIGWSGAMRRSSSSGASGPTPAKNWPTSHFQRFR